VVLKDGGDYTLMSESSIVIKTKVCLFLSFVSATFAVDIC